MDILSFIIGLVKGKNQDEDALIKIDDGIDALNNEIVGETPFTVTFVNWDGTELCQIPVYKGDDCPEPVNAHIISMPTKSLERSGYKWLGWSKTIDGENTGINNSPLLKNIRGDRTIYATFELAWIIDENDTLTVYTNHVYHEYGEQPWFEYQNIIKKVCLESKGELGPYACKNMTSLKSFEDHSNNGYGNSIREYTFEGCTEMTYAILGSSFTSIGEYAFKDCSKLNRVLVGGIFFGDPPDNLTLYYIREGAFYNCTSLYYLNIPSSILSIGKYAFHNCIGLEYVYLTLTETLFYKQYYTNGGSHIAGISTYEMETPEKFAKYLRDGLYRAYDLGRTVDTYVLYKGSESDSIL